MEKNNNLRINKYQTVTVWDPSNPSLGVRKRALNSEADNHIKSIPQKGRLIDGLYPNLLITPSRFENDEVIFDYIQGKSVDDDLADVMVKDLDAFVDAINDAFNKYLIPNNKNICDFEFTQEYRDIFGELDCVGMKCVRPCNLDVIFDNIIVNENGAYIIDYEWVYDMCIPVDFVKYRVVSHIYDKYRERLQKVVDYQHFTSLFGINRLDYPKFAQMEDLYIHSIYPREEVLEDRCREVVTNTSLVKKCYQLTKGVYHKVKFTYEDWNHARLLDKTLAGEKGFYDKYELFPTETEIIGQKSYKFAFNPLISIITPLYNTNPKFLEELIKSVLAQTYPNFELVLCDFSPCLKTLKSFMESQPQDSRIKFYSLGNNVGISDNTNTCIEHSKGDYIAILDHDDVLHPCALFECVNAINQGADFVYTDEAKFVGALKWIDVPYYKPDFSVEELRVHNYICHLNVYKKKLLDEVGYYRDIYDGSQDHDLVLRLTEKAKKIVHIRKCLYFWRMHSQSVASGIGAKPYAAFAGIRAVNAQYKRMNLPTRVWSEQEMISRYTICHASVPNDVDIEVVEYNSQADLVEIVKNTKSKYIFLKHEDLEVDEKRLIPRIYSYVSHDSCVAAEPRVEYSDGRVLNGGLVIKKGKLVFRNEGARKAACGYEDVMLHDRAVVTSSGICVLVDSRKIAPFLQDSLTITEALLKANASGYEVFLDVHVPVVEKATKLSNYVSEFYELVRDMDVPKVDPYYNELIDKFNLEKL